MSLLKRGGGAPWRTALAASSSAAAGNDGDGNCAELAQQPDIDGFLVGGGSLKGDSFMKICQARNSAAAARR